MITRQATEHNIEELRWAIYETITPIYYLVCNHLNFFSTYSIMYCTFVSGWNYKNYEYATHKKIEMSLECTEAGNLAQGTRE